MGLGVADSSASDAHAVHDYFRASPYRSYGQLSTRSVFGLAFGQACVSGSPWLHMQTVYTRACECRSKREQHSKVPQVPLSVGRSLDSQKHTPSAILQVL